MVAEIENSHNKALTFEINTFSSRLINDSNFPLTVLLLLLLLLLMAFVIPRPYGRGIKAMMRV